MYANSSYSIAAIRVHADGASSRALGPRPCGHCECSSAQASKTLHANTYAMFTQLYGSKKTFLHFMENGHCGDLHFKGKRKVPNTAKSLEVAVDCCQLPDRASYWISAVVAGSGVVRLKEPGPAGVSAADPSRKRKRPTVQRQLKKRRQYADNLLAKAFSDWPGAVNRGHANQPRTTGPGAARAHQTYLMEENPPPGAMDRVRNMIIKLDKGEEVKGWTGRHLNLAFENAKKRAQDPLVKRDGLNEMD